MLSSGLHRRHLFTGTRTDPSRTQRSRSDGKVLVPHITKRTCNKGAAKISNVLLRAERDPQWNWYEDAWTGQAATNANIMLGPELAEQRIDQRISLRPVPCTTPNRLISSTHHVIRGIPAVGQYYVTFDQGLDKNDQIRIYILKERPSDEPRRCLLPLDWL